MKTLLTASALILISNVALASSWEDAWQNPDLGTGVYDKPITLVEPMASAQDVAISLDRFNQGNSEHASHSQDNAISTPSSEGFASTLDQFNEGNPDHV
jgi:hypothetical protein